MKLRLAAVGLPTALLAILLIATSAPVSAAENLKEAFSEAEFGYNFRWRMEHVDQDPLPHNALAIPLRARIHLHTADLHGFSAKAELDYVFNFGMDNFNAGGGITPKPPGYPVIADPEGGDVNQLFLQYKANYGGQFRLGRQRIIYDNARFIGNVGWRQNEQTYDAFSYDHKTANGWQFQYAYLDAVRRIFGHKVPAGKFDLSSNLFNVAYDIKDIGKVVGYYYAIDNQDVAALSNQTLGLSMQGKLANNGPAIGYRLEYAHQSDYADNPINYKADYWRGDLSVGFEWATPYVGYESLGGSASRPGAAFQTPLATAHAFNGWADQFASTPTAGLNDLFVGVKGNVGTWNWDMLYHDFSAQSGSGDYGTEIDASIGRKFKQRFGILFKAAFFDADSPAYGDTNKFWVQLTADL